MDQTPPLPTNPQPQNVIPPTVTPPTTAAPQPQPNQPAPTAPQPAANPKSNNKTIYWIIGLAACLPMLIIGGILAALVLTNVSSSRGKAKDASVKSTVSLEMTKAEMYFDQYQTYMGYTIDPQDQSQVSTFGSKIIVQGLSDKTYVIYAKLSSSNKLFCIDSANFSGEISTISATQTSCQ